MLLQREELNSSGIYFLFGSDDETGDALAYIGEAEVVKDRLKQHKSKEFWNSVVVFVSKDENLTKAHIRHLENRLMEEAKGAGRFQLENTNQTTGSRLPESDSADMKVFLERVQQVLPVLGFDILTPIGGSTAISEPREALTCSGKGALARGRRTETGFVIFAGSTAVLKERQSAARQHPFVIPLRAKLVANGTLVEKDGFYHFTRDAEFLSPSGAGAVIRGGGAAPRDWKDKNGKTLKELESTS